MKRFFNSTRRLFAAGIIVLLLLLGGVVVALRFWLLPNIDDFRPRIAQAASSALGQEVRIGAIATEWRGPRLHLLLHDVAVLDANAQPAFALAKVETTLAWLSLISGKVRLYSLALDAPQLAIERDITGAIRVAGIEVQRGEGGFADWLLAQREVTVRDAIVTWRDQQRQAPPLEFTDVDLQWENWGSSHRFGVRATPPAAIASPLDLRGDLNGRSASDFAGWRGELYARVDFVDLAAAGTWLDLPSEITRGRGGASVWASFRDRRFEDVTADVSLANLEARLAADIPATQLKQLNGRIAWKASERGFELRAEKLALAVRDEAQPVDFSLKFVSALDTEPAQGELSVNELDVAPLLLLANTLPLQAPAADEFKSAAPSGMLKNVAFKWRGDWKAPVSYGGKMDFSQIAFAPQGKFPGVKNLSGSVEVNDQGGALKLDSPDSTVALPLVLPERIQFDRLAADLTWTSYDGQVQFDLKRIDFANSHTEGMASGTYRAVSNSRGYADLSARLTRAEARAVWRYIPLKIGNDTREWLQHALIAGNSDDVRFRLKGDLQNFPFGDTGDEVFEVTAKTKNGVLKYAEDWPPIENVNADVKFHGRRMEVTAKNATLFGAKIPSVRAEIPDLVIHDELLQVTGEAEAPTSRFLAFIEKTPVADMIERFTQDLTAEGNGALQIKIALPLRHRQDTRIEGGYTFTDNRLNVPDLPQVSAINGRLKFTESSATLEPTSASILGGPINLSASAKEGAGVAINGSGRADVENLKKVFAHPWLAQVHGAADWRGSLELRNKLANFVVESDLKGVSLELPAPLKKSAADAVQLKIERSMPALKRDQIAITYGSIASLRAARNLESKEIERAALSFGAAAILPERKSVAVSGKLASVDIDEWKNFLQEEGAAQRLPERADVDLRVGSLTISGRQFNSLHVVAARQSRDWTATVKAQDIAGALTWKTGTPETTKGVLSARFSELNVPQAAEGSAEKEKLSASDMPLVDLIAENFTVNGKRFGKLELLGVPEGPDWRIDKLNSRNPDGALESKGVWRAQPPRTELKLELKVSDIGNYLARYNYPEGVKGGRAELEGGISWPGSPMDFEYASLDGDLILVARQGRFVKLRPGLGKLLGLVSLQALPRRIKLDFKDIFSEGFEFDTIAGQLKITDGVMSTDDFSVRGTAGRIVMTGDVNLDDETQKLAIKVTPTLGDTVAIAAAIANPIAGVATYIASKVLKDPLDHFLSYEYSVRGSWEEPVVTKTSKTPQAPAIFGTQ